MDDSGSVTRTVNPTSIFIVHQKTLEDDYLHNLQ